MEPNKLETQIKKQLNAREIQPSSLAWDRLDAMLTVVEEKKNNRFHFLNNRNIGIAASIMIIVSLGFFYFSPKDGASIQENSVVIGQKNDSNNKEVITNKQDLQKIQIAETTRHNAVTLISKPNSIIQKAQPTINPIIIQDVDIEFQSNEVIAQNQFPKVIMSSQEIKVSNSIKVNAIDLLAAVDKPSKLITSPRVIVDTKSLLSQVDAELDQTFKEKALKKITKNYKEIKVAFQTRNQE